MVADFNVWFSLSALYKRGVVLSKSFCTVIGVCTLVPVNLPVFPSTGMDRWCVTAFNSIAPIRPVTRKLPVIGEPFVSVSQRYAGFDMIIPYLYL